MGASNITLLILALLVSSVQASELKADSSSQLDANCELKQHFKYRMNITLPQLVLFLAQSEKMGRHDVAQRINDTMTVVCVYHSAARGAKLELIIEIGESAGNEWCLVKSNNRKHPLLGRLEAATSNP